MDDCIFCKIVAGDIPASVVYDDDNVLAFMTIEAANKGHILVIPKQHQSDIEALDKTTYQAVMDVSQRVGRAIKWQYSPKKVGLMVQGFEVDHAHVHVLPLHKNDDITMKRALDNCLLQFERDELEAEAKQLKARLS